MAQLRCEDVMTRNPRYCEPNDSLLAPLKLMKELDVGFVPVCDPRDRRLVGVITDRDIAMALVRDVKPSNLSVNDYMSRDAITCRPGDDVMDCARRMEDNQIRRIPVVDEDNLLVGVIATADIARKATQRRELEAELPSLMESISART